MFSLHELFVYQGASAKQAIERNVDMFRLMTLYAPGVTVLGRKALPDRFCVSSQRTWELHYGKKQPVPDPKGTCQWHPALTGSGLQR